MKLRKIVMEGFKEGRGWLWFFILLWLFSLTGLDYLVNHVLIKFYGLQYQFEWFIVYGLWITLLCISGGGMTSVAYWFSTTKEKRSWFTVGAIFTTLLATWGGGILDFLWFMMRGFIDPPSKVWWWMPFKWLFGIDWTIGHQAVYTIVWILALVVIWYRVGKE